jgi:hypothetical protein
VVGVNPITRLYEGDRHGETDPGNPVDVWCGGCLAWTNRRAWGRHAWHSSAAQPASAQPAPAP